MLRLAILATILCVANAADPLSPSGLTGKEELDMPEPRKAALKQMKDAPVFKEIINPTMMKDIYLVKFLRANADIAYAAIDMLTSAIAFRKEQGFEGKTAKADVSAAIKKFEASTTEVDVEGRPIMYMQVGKWGLTDAIAAKEGEAYERAFYQIFDEVAVKAVAAFEGGKKNAQYVLLFNYEDWTFAQGGSADCVSIVGRISFHYSRTWPGFAHKFVLINTPPEFKMFLDLVKPFFTPDINQRLEVFDRTAKDWCPLVKSLMNPPQIQKYCI